jgi:hypothetical protein
MAAQFNPTTESKILPLCSSLCVLPVLRQRSVVRLVRRAQPERPMKSQFSSWANLQMEMPVHVPIQVQEVSKVTEIQVILDFYIFIEIKKKFL